jgi:LDH2 family malate/lactate/ureidoglycolate dehydrogenase
MDMKIPQPLKAEHDELHDELKRATSAGGRTAEAAREVARLLHPHFVKAEEFALPPLGLLVRVARGETLPSDVTKVAIGMAERLKMELPEMLAEHGQIVAALDALAAVAKEEGRAEIAQFAEKLKQHAKTEEEVLYPAAIVLGQHLGAAGRAR